ELFRRHDRALTVSARDEPITLLSRAKSLDSQLSVNLLRPRDRTRCPGCRRKFECRDLCSIPSYFRPLQWLYRFHLTHCLAPARNIKLGIQVAGRGMRRFLNTCDRCHVCRLPIHTPRPGAASGLIPYGESLHFVRSLAVFQEQVHVRFLKLIYSSLNNSNELFARVRRQWFAFLQEFFILLNLIMLALLK